MPKISLLSKQQKKYINDLGKREVDNYEKNLFNINQYGEETEANELIKRYESKISISEEDKKILRKYAPKKPNFAAMSKEQYEGTGCWKKRAYRNKVQNYFEGRKKYYKTETKNTKGGKQKLTPGQIYALKRQELEARFATEDGEDSLEEQKIISIAETDTIKKSESKKKSKTTSTVIENSSYDNAVKEADNLMEQYKNEGLYKDIEEDPYSMDEAFEERSKAEYSEAEKNLAIKEMEVVKSKSPGTIGLVKNYCYTGYTMVNNALRQRGVMIPGYNRLVDTMKMHPIKRDLIVRRGVANISTAGFMAGFENAGEMSEDELKEALKKKFSEGSEMIMKDKAFMSTALPDATVKFSAESGSGGIGIEFIILVKKGTPAMNVSTVSFKENEKEILIAPETKFKVVDMKLDGDAEIIEGNKKSWKIYLSTIPQSKEGILKETA